MGLFRDKHGGQSRARSVEENLCRRHWHMQPLPDFGKTELFIKAQAHNSLAPGGQGLYRTPEHSLEFVVLCNYIGQWTRIRQQCQRPEFFAVRISFKL